MKDFKIDISRIYDFIPEGTLAGMEQEVVRSFRELSLGTGKGNEFLGWITLPSAMSGKLLKKIEEQADMLRQKSEVFVVVGIGGSYLGARAVIEALGHGFQGLSGDNTRPFVVFAGPRSCLG